MQKLADGQDTEFRVLPVSMLAGVVQLVPLNCTALSPPSSTAMQKLTDGQDTLAKGNAG